MSILFKSKKEVKMDNKNIPYIIIRAYDRLEAMKIFNKFSRDYFVERESGTCNIRIVGGALVKNESELEKAVKQLESTVAEVTALSYSLVEFGTLPLWLCKRKLENGEIGKNLYGYLTPTYVDKNKVEVFSIDIDFDEEYATYLTTGTLIDRDIVSVPYKYIF